jgi:membrane-associated phospholipid phosphatase
MRKNLVLLSVGITSFCLFVIFSYLVHKNLFTGIDFDTTVRLQNNIPRKLDEIFSVFSSIGSFEPMLIVLVVILLVWRKILIGFLLFSAFVTFHIFELFGKYMVNHPPPPEFMLRTERIIQFDQFHVRTEFSYPSGHSGRAVLLACLLLFIIWNSKYSREFKIVSSILIASYVVVMLVSRIYLGEHWTSDVIGGVLLGVALSFCALSAYNVPTKYVRNKKMHHITE